ncbi:MAG: alpha/beta hydrolase [Acidimicrobiia bacterium]|nr:alpha/beta hydrolase [Acidimicrobiia bacterium]MDH5420761.1 alpha/beta hydrolase [Acidimicrobiia bacterium]MDH5502414.1 alpha/beta hydrolase [Acidimicrobiia bacterium]
MDTKWIIRGLLIATLALGTFYAYDNYASPFHSTPDVDVLLISDDAVSVTTEPRLTFAPADRTPNVGMVFYTGARVDPEAYAPLARQIADGGALVVVVKHPFNFAFFGVSEAGDVLLEHPEITNWVMAGHSLGGAMAAEFAERNQRISGLVLLAAYPGDSSNLAFRSLPSLVIYGSEDGLATPAEVEEKVGKLLSPNAELVLIEGGNHAQFGSYGPQAGDGSAAIGRQEQQDQTAAAILKFLRPNRS